MIPLYIVSPHRDDDEDYSDDEDMSWKVRRSCAKCLSAIVQVLTEDWVLVQIRFKIHKLRITNTKL